MRLVASNKRPGRATDLFDDFLNYQKRLTLAYRRVSRCDIWATTHFGFSIRFERVDFVNEGHWRRSTCIDFSEGANWEAAAEAQGHQHAHTSLDVISDDKPSRRASVQRSVKAQFRILTNTHRLIILVQNSVSHNKALLYRYRVIRKWQSITTWFGMT